MKEDNKEVKIWMPLALSIMMAIGLMFGYKMNDKEEVALIEHVSTSSKGHGKSEIGQVEELIRFIETRYVDSISRDKLTDAAISAVLEELDPHSIYISPDRLRTVNEEMDGKFKGIGVEIFYLNDTVNIINTVPEGPADKAGILPFDKVISINDSIVAGQKLVFSDIRKMLRGDIGSTLDIKVKRKSGNTETLSVIVEDIKVHSVVGGVMVDEQTGYIKIIRFGSHTYKEFMDLLERLVDEGDVKNLIIDLRDNPGGYLPQATNILSQLFKEKDRLLVYTKGKNDRKFDYHTTGKVFFPIEKIAVLIDEDSASGSEIIAGAIQDWDRGVIVGRRSFGKGLVQEQYDLSNGGALRLTVARYYSPSGRSIQRQYTDKDKYYTDYEERYYSGEFFAKDSIDAESDVIFKTKKLDREVYGGGGISPDIFIPIDSLEFDPMYNEIMNELGQFVFRSISKRKDIGTLDVNQLSNNIADEYIETKKALTGDYMVTKAEEQIRLEVGVKARHYLQSEESMYKYKLPQDPYVKASINYFYSDNKLTDLIESR